MVEKVSPSRITSNDISLGEFFGFLGANGPCSPLQGDCVSFGAAMYDVVECDSLFGTFIPNKREASGPIHMTIIISDEHYDGSGHRDKQNIIKNAEEILEEDRPEYARSIKSTTDHIRNNSKFINRSEINSYSNFSLEKYDEIKQFSRNIIENKVLCGEDLYGIPDYK